MPLVPVVITLCVVGLLLYLVNRYIPMQGQIKGILNGVVVIVVAFGCSRSSASSTTSISFASEKDNSYRRNLGDCYCNQNASSTQDG